MNSVNGMPLMKNLFIIKSISPDKCILGKIHKQCRQGAKFLFGIVDEGKLLPAGIFPDTHSVPSTLWVLKQPEDISISITISIYFYEKRCNICALRYIRNPHYSTGR